MAWTICKSEHVFFFAASLCCESAEAAEQTKKNSSEFLKCITFYIYLEYDFGVCLCVAASAPVCHSGDEWCALKRNEKNIF